MAHRTEQAAHLPECGTAGLLDAAEHIPFRCQPLWKPVPDRPGLEHHHADCVRDDVVELARDSGTLLRYRDACRGVPLPLGLGRAYLCGFNPLGTLTHGEAGKP